MKILRISLLVLTALAIIPVLGATTTVHAASPLEREPVYANGHTFIMLVPRSPVDGSSPGTARTAEPLFLLAFLINNATNTDTAPKTLPSGYQPQCNPCYHLGPPWPFAYHDHVLEGAPGFGTSGTAGSFNPIWHVFLLIYTPAYAMSLGFTPVKADEDIPAAITAGHFVNLANMGFPTVTGNQYEVDTGINFLCVILPS